MAKRKHTKLEQDQIISNVTDLILKGFSTKALHAYLKEEYGFTDYMRKHYIKESHNKFKQIDQKKCGQLRSRYRQRLEMMFNQALNVDRNINQALSIQKELNKLIEQEKPESTMPDIKLIFKTEGEDE